MNHLPMTSELQGLLKSLSAQELEEVSLLASAQTKEGETPSDYARWLIEASPRFTWYWKHQVRIRYYLSSVLQGEIDRLAITCPPRHGKSELVTIRLPAYCMELDRSFRGIIGAHSATLATKFSRRTRAIVRERGRVRLNPERQAADDWETVGGGGLRAVGVGSGITGEGGNGGIIDDPVKSRAEANSLAYRDACYEWYTDDFSTRMEPDAWIILIMTRWHEDDLWGRIMESEEAKYWTTCRMPALAEGDNDELGREPDQALCPERYDETKLARIKAVLGNSWHALYQGRPVSIEGNIIMASWFMYYDKPERKYQRRVQSWDTAQKEQQINDWSVGLTYGITANGYDLLDQYRNRDKYPDLKKAVIQQAEKHSPAAILIEDKGSGTSLIQDLRSYTRLPIIAIEPHGDKIMRLSNESPAFESGLVRHPRAVNAPWVIDYEAELVSIPNAPHDDRGDATSQFLKWAKRGTGAPNIGSASTRMFH